MTTRIVDRGPESLVTPTVTAPRVTPAPSEPFRAVMQAGARAVLDGAEGAVRRLPGGPVLAAAFRAEPEQYTSTRHALGVASPRVSGDSLSAEGPVSAGAALPPALASEPGAGDALAQHAEQNLYYLRLQEQVSAESRQYTALSNVLKARHDMVKNAIGNIR